MKYLHENQINAYIPDNQFRSRDPKFAHQKDKYGKRHQTPGKANVIKHPARQKPNNSFLPANSNLTP